MPVAIARYAAGGSDETLVLPARVKATEEVTVLTRLSARLTAFTVREGDRVKQGEPLARFDAPETQRALAAARAESEAAALALGVAVRQHERAESLYASGVLAPNDRESAESARRSAEARGESARAALDLMESGAVVRAPFDGVVVRRHVDAGADLPAGAPLVDLRSSAGLELVADVPESALERLARSPLTAQAGDGEWSSVKLSRIDGMTDFRTRTRTAHFSAGAARLEPGAYARVAIGDPAAPGVARGVPAATVVRRGSLAGVFVIEDGRARLRWLKLGREQGGRVEVIAGLAPGEAYALDPRGLADGRAVEVRP